MDPNGKFYPDKKEMLSYPDSYCCLIGKLTILQDTTTHPEISAAVSMVSQCVSTSSTTLGSYPWNYERL